jgi:hypothetical protein
MTAVSEGVAELRRSRFGLHCSCGYPAARQRYGMFDLGGPAPVLVGVAVLSVPGSRPVLMSVFPAWSLLCTDTLAQPIVPFSAPTPSRSAPLMSR